MNVDIGTQIGKAIPVVKNCDVCENGTRWGIFLLVNIEIDLQKPISQGRSINLLGNKIWVSFKDEKLPKLCFKCRRRIVHD